MRIAFVTPEFISEEYLSGGLANYVYRTARALVGLGHSVHVVVSAARDETVDFHGIRLHRLGPGRAFVNFNRLTRWRCTEAARSLAFSWRACRKLRALEKETGLDIVQCSNYQGCGILPLLLLRAPTVTRISCYRKAWTETAGRARDADERMIEKLELLQIRLSRWKFAPTVLMQRMYAQESGIKHIDVIRSPFFREAADWDDTIYRQNLAGRQYLLFFGRLQLHKGPHILGQALPGVFRAHADCHAVFVGPDAWSNLGPSTREYIRSVCSEFPERLVFIEQLPHSQLYPVISHAKLVVLPSLIDNLPNTLLEAMGFGKPVVGTVGASFDEVLADGETGFLVAAGDPEALSRKIIEAWTDPRLDEIGKAAAVKAGEFAPDRTVRQLLDYYERVIGK